jgi:hypothetical protein
MILPDTGKSQYQNTQKEAWNSLFSILPLVSFLGPNATK